MIPSVAVLLVLVSCSHSFKEVFQECSYHEECPKELACDLVLDLCKDPCEFYCGNNTTCQVMNHIPVCSCVGGYLGDPKKGCISSATPECYKSKDCPEDKICIDQRCQDPCISFCGSNTVCRVEKHLPTCICTHGSIGDPMAGCLPAEDGKCFSRSDCPEDKTCDAGQCQDPCINVCGNNTDCRAANHEPVCSCIQGYAGDPMIGCTISEYTPSNATTTTSKNSKKKFKLSTLRLNWLEAFLNCQATGMRMATIENLQQNDDLVSSIGEDAFKKGIWLGATDLIEEGNWIWMTTGKSIRNYMNWFMYNPSNRPGENCLMQYILEDKISWGDTNCSRDLLFVCEYY